MSVLKAAVGAPSSVQKRQEVGLQREQIGAEAAARRFGRAGSKAATASADRAGSAPAKTGPISNKAAWRIPRRALAAAAAISPGKIDGRRQSISAAIGFSSRKDCAPPPNSRAA